MSNYRFTKGNERNKILIKKNGTKFLITLETLTDELAELVINTPGLSHNIEVIPGREINIISKKKEQQTGEVQLPEYIVLALKEAGVDKSLSDVAQYPKELDLNSSKRSTGKNTKQGKKKK